MAEVKRSAHLALLHRWLPDLSAKSLLKTDLWEEGVAGDELLFTLARRARAAWGTDVSPVVVAAARGRAGPTASNLTLLEGSVLDLPLPSRSLDAIVSTSTIDHLDGAEQHRAAIWELRRVLAPGGVVVITVDNRDNLLDPALRLAAALGLTPFPVGSAPRVEELVAMLRHAGLRPDRREYLVPAPRVLATALVRLARLLPAGRSDAAVARVLAGFDALGRRAPARLGCFVGVRAVAD